MKFVDPIRKKTDITNIKNIMIENGDIKMAILFVAGINTGLRISDLLKITHEDLQQDSIHIKEQKTGKNRKLTWNNEIKKLYLFNLKNDVGEENNLSSQYPEKRDELLKKLKKWPNYR